MAPTTMPKTPTTTLNETTQPVSGYCYAKIVATLGPASSSVPVLTDMIEAGLSIARLNMSHGEHGDQQERLELVRKVSNNVGRAVGVMADLQGPKIRTGILENRKPVELVTDSTVLFEHSDEPGNAKHITSPNGEIFEALTEGTQILINDGLLKLRVTKVLSNTQSECVVEQGGELNERKGINVPEKRLNVSAVTEKDKEDAIFAVKAGVDFIALSFVQSASDIWELKNFLAENNLPVPPIIAKIEKPQALDEIDAIFEEADAIMVARGDLGVELPPERVPMVQKQLIEKGLLTGKPVIVATQMLDSMTHNSTPSRAEVSDVANAVFDGADALMLSQETAMGSFPVETIAMMRRVIMEAESYMLQTASRKRPHETSDIQSPHYHHAIANAASYLSRKADVEAVVVLSESGSMAKRVSKLRPNHPIIALTEDEHVMRRMALLWGVRPLQIHFQDTTDATLYMAEAAMLKHNLLDIGDGVLFCSGLTPIEGATNMLKLFNVGDPIKSATGLLNPM